MNKFIVINWFKEMVIFIISCIAFIPVLIIQLIYKFRDYFEYQLLKGCDNDE